MNRVQKYGNLIIALLFAGSAMLLMSCGGDVDRLPDSETMITQDGDSLMVVESKNGIKSFRFRTPKMISYDLAREPYTIYPNGVFVETFRDSTEEIESTLIANYAINYKNRKRSLWEAVGNVVATGEDGRTLYTEQLFWDEATGRIYSNVDSKVVQEDRVSVGEGFESDQTLKHWEFHNTRSKASFILPEGDGSSSTPADHSAPEDGLSESSGGSAASQGNNATSSGSGAIPSGNNTYSDSNGATRSRSTMPGAFERRLPTTETSGFRPSVQAPGASGRRPAVPTDAHIDGMQPALKDNAGGTASKPTLQTNDGRDSASRPDRRNPRPTIQPTDSAGLMSGKLPVAQQEQP